MRIGFVQWPDGLKPCTDTWSVLAEEVVESEAHVLVTNEMPFGRWLAASPIFDAQHAEEAIRTHDVGIGALPSLKVPIVVSSRAVISYDLAAAYSKEAGIKFRKRRLTLDRSLKRGLLQESFDLTHAAPLPQFHGGLPVSIS